VPRPLPVGRLGHGEIPIDGRATDLDTSCDGGNSQALGVQPLNVVVQVYPSFVALLTDQGRGYMWFWEAVGRQVRERSAEGVETLPMAEKEPF
jgi:hypothetical protein